MKIGILTFWWSQENYGQILQCYASQKFLQQLGHDAFLIKYKALKVEEMENDNPSIITKIFSIPHWNYLIKLIWRKCHHSFVNKYIQNHEIDRHFEEFKEKYIRSTAKIYDIFELKKKSPEVDVLVAGSDMVWGSLGRDPIFYLDFGKHDVLRISLAASFGRQLESLSENDLDRIKILLSRFNTLTLREDEGVRICKAIGFCFANQVCDPTMLLDRIVYDRIADTCSIGDCSKKVLLYYLGDSKSKIGDFEIVHIIRQSGADFNYISSDNAVNRIPKVFASIEEWLCYIRNSKFVITNSFHGLLFSLMFRKQFAVIALDDEGKNSRIYSVLRKFGLYDRICHKKQDLYKCLNTEIDYDVIYKKINLFIENSRNKIIESLSIKTI